MYCAMYGVRRGSVLVVDVVVQAVVRLAAAIVRSVRVCFI